MLVRQNRRGPAALVHSDVRPHANLLFILDVMEADFVVTSGLHLKVKDYDLGPQKSDDLGSITIDPKTLLEAKGERMVFKLNPPLKKEGKDAGHIAIRCRRATNYDREFLDSLESKTLSSYLGVDEDLEKAKPQGGGGAKLLQKNFMVGKYRLLHSTEAGRVVNIC